VRIRAVTRLPSVPWWTRSVAGAIDEHTSPVRWSESKAEAGVIAPPDPLMPAVRTRTAETFHDRDEIQSAARNRAHPSLDHGMWWPRTIYSGKAWGGAMGPAGRGRGDLDVWGCCTRRSTGRPFDACHPLGPRAEPPWLRC